MFGYKKLSLAVWRLSVFKALSWVYPHMATFSEHFKSILYQNYDPFREPLRVRFDGNPTRTIPQFSVGYVDGMTKGLCGQVIVAIIWALEPCLQKLWLVPWNDFSWILNSAKFPFNLRIYHRCCTTPQSFCPCFKLWDSTKRTTRSFSMKQTFAMSLCATRHKN